MRLMLVSLGAVLLSGCAGQLEDIGRAPEMTPVGYGLANRPATVYPLGTFSKGGIKDYNSLWRNDRENFFADPRAKKIGDVLTVVIQIDDRAELDNTSERGRSADIGIGGSLFSWQQQQHIGRPGWNSMVIPGPRPLGPGPSTAQRRLNSLLRPS
jgi:flagellar L-ring protein precursor FlgH